MPRVSIEFSKGLELANNMQSVCNQLYSVLAEQDEFDPPTLKIRAAPIEFFRIGTEPQTFIHATLFLMAGRDEDTDKGPILTFFRLRLLEPLFFKGLDGP